MNTRMILGANLNALMASRYAAEQGLDSNKKLGLRLKISDNTVGRIRRGENSIGIDMLDRIAALFKLQSWQLLVPDLDLGNPPSLRAMSEHERALYDRLRELVRTIEPKR